VVDKCVQATTTLIQKFKLQGEKKKSEFRKYTARVTKNELHSPMKRIEIEQEQKRKEEIVEEEQSEEEESEVEKYTVEKILKKRETNKGNRRSYQYLVKWEGYPTSQATWEPTSNLQGCQELLKEFNANYTKEKNDKLRRRSLQRLEEIKKSKRKYIEEEEEESPKNKKRKVSIEEEEEVEENDSNDSEFDPDKEEDGQKPKTKGRVKKTPTKIPQSPGSTRSLTNRNLRSSKLFNDDDAIVVDDPHFSVHQTSDERRQIQRYLEKLKDLTKTPSIKLLNSSQLLAAQSLTSKLMIRLSHYLNQSLTALDEEKDSSEEIQKNGDNSIVAETKSDIPTDDTIPYLGDNDENARNEDKQNNDEIFNEIPLPLD